MEKVRQAGPIVSLQARLSPPLLHGGSAPDYRTSSVCIAKTTRQRRDAVASISSRTTAHARRQTAEHLSGALRYRCPGEGRPCARPMTGSPPKVVLAESAPAALAGANIRRKGTAPLRLTSLSASRARSFNPLRQSRPRSSTPAARAAPPCLGSARASTTRP